MAIAAAVKYTVRLHVDNDGYPYGGDSSDVSFNKNIVFDGIDVESFNDGSIAAGAAPTHGVMTVVVGNNPGNELDSFKVQTAYPLAFAGTDPGTLRVNDHIIYAFDAITAIINQTAFVAQADVDLATTVFGGGGPSPIIATFSGLVGGTGYPASLTNFLAKLTGGSGYGATGLITTNGSGVVTGCTLAAPGAGYQVGDVLGASIGVIGNAYPSTPGTGFHVTVATVASPITNTSYA